jgi:putative ABC transport system permease protein
MGALWQDLRYGARMLRKKPGFTLVAAITLALGIGANSAMFGLIDGLLLRPLPFKDMDRLAVVWGTLPQGGPIGRFFGISPADFVDFREQQQVFEHLAAHQWAEVNLTGGAGEPERVQGYRVTQNLFTALGVNALHGRTFLPEEELAGNDDVVLLSQGLWNRRFAGDKDIVGQRITLNGRSCVVVGVIPDGYEWPIGAELWMPLVMTPELKRERAAHSLTITGLRKPGVTIEQAQEEMERITRRLADRYPETNLGRGVNLARLPGGVAEYYLQPLLALLGGGVAFVLLIACANVANLQLTRAAGRQKEIAIRAALGAGRWRVIRQLLTESVMLSSAGAALGLLIAPWLIDYAKASVPQEIRLYLPGLRFANIDLRCLGYTMALSLLAGIIAGLAPAFQASKTDLYNTLKEGGRSVAGASRRNLRGALVVAEVALALVLLISTGLTVRGFAQLSEQHKQGFDSTRLLTMRIALPESKYAEHHQRVDFFQKTLERVESTPGVVSAAIINDLPASNNWDQEIFEIEGRPAPSPADKLMGVFGVISADYFRTMRIPLIQGRAFTKQDEASATPVAIISGAAARRFFPNRSPLGQRIRVEIGNGEWPWHTIVGVVGDVRQFVFDREMRAMVYLPYAQLPRPWSQWMTLAFRATGDPLGMVPAVREQISAVDPDQPVYRIKTMEQTIVEHISPISLSAEWMAGFGLLALILAAVGVYSVMAYAVSQRTREIAVRIALGAQTDDVLRMVTGQGMKLVMVGVAIGLIAAFVLGRALAGWLYGVDAIDPITFGAVATGLAAIALLACYIPARRATKVDPIVALRCE